MIRAQEQRVRKAQSGRDWLCADRRALLKGEGVDRAELFPLGDLSVSRQTISSLEEPWWRFASLLPFVDLGVVNLASQSLSFLA